MSQSRYFVSHDGAQLGPFNVEEITAKITARELFVSDYVFDEKANDWFMIIAHEQFTSLLQFAKPEQAPRPEPKKAAVDAPEWFVLKGQNRFGPYSYFEIVKLLQSRSLFEYDYAWNPNLETWHLIADLHDFKPDRIKELQTSTSTEMTEVFFRRRHARVNYGASLIIHNNSKIWKGKSFEISPGGAGIELETGTLQIGQSINIHFKAGDEVPPFNSKCEVVSLRSMDRGNEKKVIYGIKFLELAQQTQDHITQFTEKNADKEIETNVKAA